jgi:hypothetical protein
MSAVALPAAPIHKLKWIETAINIKGQQYRFGPDQHGYTRRHLLNIHACVEKPVLLKCGRQVEKSTNLGITSLYNCWAIPYLHAVYVSSSQAQTGRFSSSVVRPMLQDSTVLNEIFYQPQRLKDNVSEKHFANASKLYLAYAFLTADRARGISGDMLMIDEIQDILLKNVHVLEEVLSHSEYKMRIYSGTPKTFENAIEHYWAKLSTQNEWCIKCDHCGSWNVLGLQNIGKEGLICNKRKCRKPLNRDSKNAMWVRMGDDDAEFEGFRISQLMVPWVRWKDILLKYDNYNEQEFSNEVLGISAESANAVLKEYELRSACLPDERRPDRAMVLKRPESYYRFMVAGVDWGKGLGSYTVLTIGGFQNDVFDILYCKKYNPQHEDVEDIIDDIAKCCAKMGVRAIGADWGAGYTENVLLRKRAEKRQMDVIQFYSSSSQKPRIRWNKQGKFYTINRQATMADVFNHIKRGEMLFPRWEDFEPFARDFLCIFPDFHDSSRIMYFNHPAEIPDDAMHSTNYAFLVAKLERKFG